MFLIWHNGGEYSGRWIYFLDCGAHDAESVAALCRFLQPGGQEIARGASLDWRDKRGMTTPAALVDDYYHASDLDDVRRSLLRAIPADLLARTLERHGRDFDEPDREAIAAALAQRQPGAPLRVPDETTEHPATETDGQVAADLLDARTAVAAAREEGARLVKKR